MANATALLILVSWLNGVYPKEIALALELALVLVADRRVSRAANALL